MVTPAPRARRIRRLLLAVLVLAMAVDLMRPPAAQASTRAALLAIRAYQTALSPALTAMGVRCRFTPTCSHYAEAVIARDGVLRGTWLAMKRLARCGPWTPAGTVDEP